MKKLFLGGSLVLLATVMLSNLMGEESSVATCGIVEDPMYVVQAREIEEEPKLSNEEFELVCRVVSAEARGESLEGQKAVAEVIKNRANNWGMTPTEVVTAPKQFAKPYKGQIPESVELAVDSVFHENESVLNDQTIHFHSGSKPYWAANENFVAKIGNHYFYK